MSVTRYEGRRFGSLVAQRRLPGSRYECLCDCGNTTIVRTTSLTSGNTSSCGCKAAKNTIGDRRRTHGQRKTPAYTTWSSMMTRCYNSNAANYWYYGGRGIRVCKRWHEFSAFYEDMGERPKGHTLDRIDPDGDYTPSNCRWATHSTQMSNKRADN